jgi:DNA-directed RNA polymerase specialized sigma24 family protein
MPRPSVLRRRGAVISAIGSVRRQRVASALESCGESERAILALLLLERLTPGQAADVLGMPVARLERTYRDVLADLERVAAGAVSRITGGPLRRRVSGDERMRRAS